MDQVAHHETDHGRDHQGEEHLGDTGEFAVHEAVSYTHLRAHETVLDLVCRLLLEKNKNKQYYLFAYSTLRRTRDESASW